MPHPFTEIIVQIFAGISSGGVGAQFLEAVILPTAAGNPVLDDFAINEWVIRVLLAFMVGGTLNLIVGLLKNKITKPSFGAGISLADSSAEDTSCVDRAHRRQQSNGDQK